MMKPTILLAALLVASTPAAAAKFGISFQPSADQSLRMQSGVGSLDSHTSRGRVRLDDRNGEGVAVAQKAQ